MKNLKLLTVVCSLAILAFASCSKGAAGPKGATGATGPAGPDSVLHSAWLTLAMSGATFINSAGNTDTAYTDTITASHITQRILDSAVILTYLSITDQNGITNVVNASVYFYSEIFAPGNIYLTSINADYSGFSYRYVIIPGSVLIGNSVLKGYTRAQLQKADYSTVVSALAKSGVQLNN
jgi:hypothetical protein